MESDRQVFASLHIDQPSSLLLYKARVIPESIRTGEMVVAFGRAG